MWHRWVQFWRELRLPAKLLLVYTPLIILPSAAGIWLLTESSAESSREISEAYATDLLRLMVRKIDDRIGGYEQFSKQVMTDVSLHQLMLAAPQTEFEKLSIQTEMNEKLNVLWLGDEQNRYVVAIKIVSGGKIYSYGNHLNAEYGVFDEAYIASLRAASGGAVWTGPETFRAGGRDIEVFRIGRAIRDESLRELGTVTLVVDTQAFSSIFAQTEFQDRVLLQLTDGQGRVLLDNGVAFGPSERNPLRTRSEESASTGWSLSATMSLESLYAPIYRVGRLALVIVLGCIVLGLMVTRALAVDIVIPIRKLMANMRQGIKGVRPNELARFRGAVEIVEMNDTFISVMYEIEQLIQQVVKEQQRKQEAAMRVLQNQLSPHFLYNTLNSLRWMAILQKQDHMKDMIDALNRLLQYSFRGAGKPVALREELAALDDYASIQKVRYRHFTLLEQLEDGWKDALILKFLLQPLIENALIHGIATTVEDGVIAIGGERRGGTLLLSVRDNGQGIPPNKLAELRKRLQEGTSDDRSVGLANVHERIQLHYGSKYGLDIDSAPGEGTIVRLRLPYIEGKEEQP